jgi:hypothetical protein
MLLLAAMGRYVQGELVILLGVYITLLVAVLAECEQGA